MRVFFGSSLLGRYGLGWIGLAYTLRREGLCAAMALAVWYAAPPVQSVAAQPAMQDVRAVATLPKVDLRVGGETIHAEVANTPAASQRGLMFRSSMPENSGMIFVFEPVRQVIFWMKNTSLPLTIGFLDKNGVLLETRDMEPFDETNIVSQSDQVAFALEMNRGWFAIRQIKPGVTLKPVGTTWAKLKKM